MLSSVELSNLDHINQFCSNVWFETGRFGLKASIYRVSTQTVVRDPFSSIWMEAKRIREGKKILNLHAIFTTCPPHWIKTKIFDDHFGSFSHLECTDLGTERHMFSVSGTKRQNPNDLERGTEGKLIKQKGKFPRFWLFIIKYNY